MNNNEAYAMKTEKNATVITMKLMQWQQKNICNGYNETFMMTTIKLPH